MAGLGDTVADLVRRFSSPEAFGAGPLTDVPAFGSNPGSLRMLMHVPAGLAPNAPLVVVLHGCGQTASGYAHGAGWIELADHFRFAVLCPEQAQANNVNRCFNWFEPGDIARGAGEVVSIAQMVARATKDHRLDPAGVFVTGLSAGGAMAAAMLATYPELFAGGAVIAGLPYGTAANMQDAFAAMRTPSRLSGKALGDRVRAAAPAPRRWPRVSIWQGDADTIVTPAAADALVRQWTDVHGVSVPEAVTNPSPRHRISVWRGADGAALVERHDVAGMGHGAPLSALGDQGWGTQGPYLLEVGVSSSLLIAQSWGIVPRRFKARPSAAQARKPEPPPESPGAPPPGVHPLHPVDVGQVISRALRSAGLVR